MFSLSVHMGRGSLSLVQCSFGRGRSLSGGSPWTEAPPRQRTPWTENPLQRDTPRYGKERMVRILLECILVRNQTHISRYGKYNFVILYLVTLCVVDIYTLAYMAGIRVFCTHDFVV